MSLEGRIAVVTGASGGLGPAVVRALVEDGAKVVAVGRRREPLDVLADSLSLPSDRIVPAAADVTDPESMAALRQRALQAVERVDILVNLAGGFRGGSVLTAGVDLWDDLFRLNAVSVLLACQTFVPDMAERGYGKVVNVAAQSALRARRNNAVYAASKSAVLRLTEALAEEVGDRGVTVNAVLPGTIDTPSNRTSMPKADPSGWTPPEAVAEVIRFLVSDQASAIHGAAIPV